MNAKIWMSIASGTMTSAGAAMTIEDQNPKGTEHVAGQLLRTGGTALQSLALGNTHGFDNDLKVIADSIYSYLGQQPPDAANDSGGQTPAKK